jgi:hypothetical protein
MLIFHPKMKFVAQQQLTANPRQLSNNATLPFFKVRNLIVKKTETFHWRGMCKRTFSWNSHEIWNTHQPSSETKTSGMWSRSTTHLTVPLCGTYKLQGVPWPTEDVTFSRRLSSHWNGYRIKKQNGLENLDYGHRGSASLTTRHPFIRKSWHILRRQAVVARSA